MSRPVAGVRHVQHRFGGIVRLVLVPHPLAIILGGRRIQLPSMRIATELLLAARQLFVVFVRNAGLFAAGAGFDFIIRIDRGRLFAKSHAIRIAPMTNFAQ